MGTITTWLADLECTATSPDGTVRVRLAGRGPVAVRLSPEHWRRHSESSLARQVAAAVQDVLISYQESVDERRFGGRDPRRLARAGDDFAKRQLRFQQAMASVAATATSTARYVEAEWRGMAGIGLRIESGAVARLDRPRLTGEIQSAIAAAGRARNRQVLRLSERYFGPIPHPAGKGGDND